jgi:hypothetical protein
VTVALKSTARSAQDMMPLFSSLTGGGTLQTSQLALHDFPAMETDRGCTRLQILNNPTMRDLKAAFQIRTGHEREAVPT